MAPSDPLSKHFRLNAPHLLALKKLGIVTVRDLLYHFPARYERGGASERAERLIPGAKVTLFGTLSKLKAKKLWRSRRTATTGVFEDASGKVPVMWFNQPYIASYVPEGAMVKLSGVVGGKAEKPYIANPQVEVLPPGSITERLFETGGNDEKAPSIFPVYPESRGISSLWFYHALERLFAASAHIMEDPIPADVRAKYNLPDLPTALHYIHKPEKEAHAEAARKRFAFEEIFSIQIARAQERAQNDAQMSFPIADAEGAVERFLSETPFPPTGAQRRAISDILQDFSKQHPASTRQGEPRRGGPMARLLEGDVGAGKTLVAAAASYAVVTSRPPNRLSGTLQVAYMAPTEILAQQHFQSFIEYFKDLPINIALITGSGCKKFPSKLARGKATDISRSQLLKWVQNGEIAMLVGTHALIQKAVKFQHLALAIVDEQHRFGTAQRRALAQKTRAADERGRGRNAVRGAGMAVSEPNRNTVTNTPGPRNEVMRLPTVPHFLSMTATPIPRTLALTIYGDLDISVLDELPPGRAKITTKIVAASERAAAYEKVRAELKKGRQAYVICPRIEEPDPKKLNALQAKSAKAEAKRLQEDIFPEYSVGLLHGSMKPKDKDEAMRDFTANETQILVATSVVEVGVNVPNATVIMIEGAERFGLAQLHQLRGRVMRSSHPPLCFLLPETRGEVAMKRLKALETSADGFKLAEADLETRGAGDLYGRKQWGVTDIGMEALKNVKLIQAAREEAQQLVAKDPTLSKHDALRLRVADISGALHSE